MKKKTAIVAAVAAGSVAVGGAAWAYISVAGSGGGSASASANTDPIVFDAEATITELDTAVPIDITGTSPAANRHIGSLTVALGTMPAGCDPDWFTLSSGGTTNFGGSGFTFTSTGPTSVPAGLTITLENQEDAPQNACLGTDNIPLTVTAS